MILRAKPIYFEAQKPIVLLNKNDADDLGIKASDRIEVSAGKKRQVAIVNTTEGFVAEGEIGLYGSVQDYLGVKLGDGIRARACDPPESLKFIKKRMKGEFLDSKEINKIIEDTVDNKLSEIELTAFVISLCNKKLSLSEAAAMSNAMARTGSTIRFGSRRIFDKHGIGGIPGDKTSMLVVPIVAAAGLTIPKTSSRAITSPAGTADRMECLCPVNLSVREIVKVVSKAGGCLVWGGALNLAPADNIFVNIEYPFSIDPLLLPSILSKKKAVNSKYVVIDMPTGDQAKIKNTQEAEELASSFIKLGKRLGMKISCVSTFGEQPLGRGIGPALEAREALEAAHLGKGPADLIDKATNIAGMIMEMAGLKNGREKALHILKSGKALSKLRQIMELQGGNPDLRPSDIPVGDCTFEIKSERSGKVWWIKNASIVQIAKEAGAPKDKGAGVYMFKKTGEHVERGETLFKVFCEKARKRERALEAIRGLDTVGVSKRFEMLLEKMPGEEEEKRYFVLER